MASLNYKNYLQRNLIDADGNAHLLWDKDGYLSYTYKGKQTRLISPYKDFREISGEHIRRSWWGQGVWDFHAAELRKNRLRIFIRARLDTDFDTKVTDSCIIEIWEFDRKSGTYVGKEIPSRDNSNDKVFRYNLAYDRDAIEKYGVNWFSALESWLLSNSELTSRYISERGSHNSPKKLGRLEDYAFEQWSILNSTKAPPYSTGIVQDEENSEEGKEDELVKYTLTRTKQIAQKLPDLITNFNPPSSVLEVDADSFGIDGFPTFGVGKRKKIVKKLSRFDIDFLYDQKKGGLYFNENGAGKGFGDGGIIAILKGAPDLTSDNLEFL